MTSLSVVPPKSSYGRNQQQPQHKRASASLSINVGSSSGSGPRPLTLIGDGEYKLPTPPLSSAAASTPTTSTSARKQARRQSSISYNVHSPTLFATLDAGGGVASPKSAGFSRHSVIGTPASVQGSSSKPELVSTPALKRSNSLVEVPERYEEKGANREMTIMELHAPLLAEIAQKEERCLELKSALKTSEDELAMLKRKWQNIVSRSTRSSPLSPTTSRTPHRTQSSQTQTRAEIATRPKPDPKPNPKSAVATVAQADPMHALTSPTTPLFDNLKEGVQGVSRFLASFAPSPSPTFPDKTPSAPPSGQGKGKGANIPQSIRRNTRENRDSASSAGTATTDSSGVFDTDGEGRDGSKRSSVSSVSVEECLPLHEGAERKRLEAEGDEDDTIRFGVDMGSSTSLSRRNSASADASRSHQRRGSRLSSSSPMSSPSASASRQTLTRSTSSAADKRRSNSGLAPLGGAPGLGLVGMSSVVGKIGVSDVVDALFGSGVEEPRTSPLTLKQKDPMRKQEKRRSMSAMLEGLFVPPSPAPSAETSTPETPGTAPADVGTNGDMGNDRKKSTGAGATLARTKTKDVGIEDDPAWNW